MLRKATLFYLLAIGFSWATVGVFLLAGGSWQSTAAIPVGVLYMYGAAVAAVVTEKLTDKRPLKEALGLRFKLDRWWAVAWLVPPVLALVAFAVGLALPGVRYSAEMAGMFERFSDLMSPEQLAQMEQQIAELPVHPFWLTLLQGLVGAVTINAAAALGEEVGWRGLLHDALAPLGFWRRSAVIGLLWGLWHAPIVAQGHNYPQHPVLGVGMMVLFTLLWSPLFTYVRIKSGTVWAAVILHGSINGNSALAMLLLAGGSDLTVGMTGLAGLVVLGAANLALGWHLRRRAGAV